MLQFPYFQRAVILRFLVLEILLLSPLLLLIRYFGVDKENKTKLIPTSFYGKKKLQKLTEY